MGKCSEPGTGVPDPPLTFVVCDLGTSPHLTLELMFPVFHPAPTMFALCARLRGYRPGPALP